MNESKAKIQDKGNFVTDEQLEIKLTCKLPMMIFKSRKIQPKANNQFYNNGRSPELPAWTPRTHNRNQQDWHAEDHITPSLHRIRSHHLLVCPNYRLS